jgi:hypothetical protein
LAFLLNSLVHQPLTLSGLDGQDGALAVIQFTAVPNEIKLPEITIKDGTLLRKDNALTNFARPFVFLLHTAGVPASSDGKSP